MASDEAHESSLEQGQVERALDEECAVRAIKMRLGALESPEALLLWRETKALKGDTLHDRILI